MELQAFVLKVGMHCEDCDRKVRKFIRVLEGVESVVVEDYNNDRVVVKGQRANPFEVLKQVKNKFPKKEVMLLSVIPKPPPAILDERKSRRVKWECPREREREVKLEDKKKQQERNIDQQLAEAKAESVKEAERQWKTIADARVKMDDQLARAKAESQKEAVRYRKAMVDARAKIDDQLAQVKIRSQKEDAFRRRKLLENDAIRSRRPKGSTFEEEKKETEKMKKLQQPRPRITNCEPPPAFLCPILMEVMRDPHMAADGHSYEGKAIKEWLRGNDKSPMTLLRLPHQNLIPNHALRSAIHDWM